MNTRLALVLVALLGLAIVSDARAQPGTTPPKPWKGPKIDYAGAVESPGFETDRFIIACWVPSFFDLEKWAQRGINVAWFNQGLNPREKTLAEYVARADSVGIKMWRYPAEHMTPPAPKDFDKTDPTLIAYSLIDEPILHKMSPEQIMDQAKAFKEAAPRDLKLILNLEGDKFVMPEPRQNVIDQHAGYMEAADIGFVDWYVKNRNADRYPLSHLWTAVERLVIWGKGKPIGAFIECSNQRIAPEGREPTPGEMRGQIIGSIIHGARLIAYFPEVPGKKDNKGKQFGNMNDGTPPELEVEMVKINKQLQALAPILCAPGARLKTGDNDPIAGVRWYKNKTYLIILNDDDKESVTVNGEKLGPWEWAIYDAGPAPAGKSEMKPKTELKSKSTLRR